ncbi:MAG: radical SAM protein [Defluviitaleaceae bacterium]|nr:radical SAM protein [Defluviitaleaceae bacterium]
MLKSVGKDDAVQLILKLSGNECNIDCVYCYEKQREYSGIKYLSANILEKSLSSFNGRTIYVQLHGGEPLLMSKQEMKEIIETIRKFDGEYHINIQTNATLLSAEWLDFFEEFCPELELGISIDGDADCNSFRVDYNNNPTFNLVDKALRLCEERGKNVGIISVVNRNSLNKEENILDYFSRFTCIKMINFMSCIHFDDSKLEEDINHWATTSFEYVEFIKRIFNVWKRKEYYKNFFIDPIFSIIRKLHGKTAIFCHYNDSKCNNIFTLFPDGSLKSCDELNLSDSIHSPDMNLKDRFMLNKMNQLLNVCKKCDYYEVCSGGCLGIRSRYENIQDRQQYCLAKSYLIDFIAESINVKPIKSLIPEEDYE